MRAISLVFLMVLAGCGGSGLGEGSIVGNCPILGGTTPFSFSPHSGVSLNTPIVSNTVTIRCGSNMGIRVVGGSYSIDGGTFTSADGTITDGQRLRVRVMSASTFATTTSASVQVGNLGTFNVVNAKFSVTTVEGDSSNAPIAIIEWPLDDSTVNATRISVRGSASDPDGVAEVRVNDVLATSSDGFSTWSADVALVSGLNTITVSTADTFLNRNPIAAEITVNNLAVVATAPIDIAVDEVHSRALVLDSGLPALIEIDFTSGEHRLVSDNTTPNNDVPFVEPHRIALNDSGDRALIIDFGYEDLILVDLTTGSRQLIADTTMSDPSATIADARDIAIDPISNRGLLLVGTLNGALNDTRIIALDLATGARTLLSDATTPDGDNPLGKLFDGVSLQFDSAGYRLLVFQESNVLAVDPLSGVRTVLSPDGIKAPVDASLDVSNNRVLVLNRFSSSIHSVDLNTGDIGHLWHIPEYNPQRIALDEMNDRVLVLLSPRVREIFAIDTRTGEFSIAY